VQMQADRILQPAHKAVTRVGLFDFGHARDYTLRRRSIRA
jgi:hypothetical protein